ncbi:hypothetical protein NHX12_033996 [Muraenolepis orangiensis]|uniref:eEF1A lysine and N-terminal methyltransferase n=1 Tax=Muraenolepis orangiensis TaxID=630683 RepID=A0A9Q0E4T1_9TELE|nr:hypothetical protein NHX12_033996 [Muraenolepis orangiensis]
MSLLPRSTEEFSSADYWERFFTKRGDKAFEWYGDYGRLCGVLHTYIKVQHKMYDVGYNKLTNIDISETVVTHMNQRNATRRPQLTFQRVDATQTHYEDASFQACLDKGTLDAMASEEEGSLARKMLTEVSRLLCVGGRYVCVTLAQESVAKLALEHFVSLGWAVRFHCLQEEAKSGEDSLGLPVFVLICTKFRQPMPSPILEMCLGDGDGAPGRYATSAELLTAIREMQSYAMLRKQLRTRTDASSSPSLTLCHVKTGLPRYTLTVQDRPPNAKVPRSNYFGVFIVPQGKETDWQYGSSEGRGQLAASANFKRLVVVAMHRDQLYTDMQAVQTELSQMVPFLSVGGQLGWREVVSRGVSQLSGEYCVEDVRGEDGELYRRLIFLSNASLIQSEGRLIPSSHAVADRPISVLQVGLGGGSLAQFLRDFVPRVRVEVVELDPAVLQVAEGFFGFRADERLTVTLGDGLERIDALAEDGGCLFDAIIIDVDGKDNTVGMSCPPQAFVQTSFLEKVRDLLNPNGVFMLNLVCRDSGLRASTLERLRVTFPRMLSRTIEGEVNMVLLCSRGGGEEEESSAPPPLPSAQAARSLQAALSSRPAGTATGPKIDIVDLVKNLKVA